MTNPREHGFPSRARLSSRMGKTRNTVRRRPSAAFVAAIRDFPGGGAPARRRVSVGPWRGESLGARYGNGGPRCRGDHSRRCSDRPKTKRHRSQRPRGLRASLRRILLSERHKLGWRRGLRCPVSGRAHRALHGAGRLGQDRGRGFNARRALLRSARGQSLSNHVRQHLPLSSLARSRLFCGSAERPYAAKGRCGGDAERLPGVSGRQDSFDHVLGLRRLVASALVAQRFTRRPGRHGARGRVATSSRRLLIARRACASERSVESTGVSWISEIARRSGLGTCSASLAILECVSHRVPRRIRRKKAV